jgi:hypothetical protein
VKSFSDRVDFYCLCEVYLYGGEKSIELKGGCLKLWLLITYQGCRFITYFTVPSTRYAKTGGIIKAESLETRSSLFKDIESTKKDYPILSWKWKVSNVVRSAIETRKDRHDAAARVMVVLEREMSFNLLRIFLSNHSAKERRPL